jgi:hypothetical protein
MKRLVLVLIFTVLFLVLVKISMAVPIPPPIPPPPDEDIEDGSDDIPENCTDNIKNQNETDVDCGGVCDKCANGRSCLTDSDCESGYCNPDDECSAPSCYDGWRNGNETDVDCGGNCMPCPDTTEEDDNQYQEDDEIEETDEQTEVHEPVIPLQDTGYEDEEPQEEPDVNEEPKKGKSVLFIISMFLVFIIIISLSVFLFLRYKKSKEISDNRLQKPGFSSYQRANTNAVKLNNFIRTCLSRGYNPESIRKILLRNRWSKQQINKAFNEVKYGSRRAF